MINFVKILVMNRRRFFQVGTAVAVATGMGGIMPAIAAASNPLLHSFGIEEPGPLTVRFLGTGAADWDSRDARGELRRFSSILLDSRILVDFTPSDGDMLSPEFASEAIFYTHSHADHFHPAAALKLHPNRIFLGETWIDRARADFDKASVETGLPVPEIIPLAIGDRVTVGGMTLTALPANHATRDLKEQALIYLIEKGSVRLLYATDTGGIPAVAARLAGIDPHSNGKPITGLIMEATMGMEGDEDFRIFTHSSVKTVERTVHMLIREGRFTPKDGQPVYLTHLARTLHGTQAELDATLPPPLKAASDGLEVEFE